MKFAKTDSILNLPICFASFLTIPVACEACYSHTIAAVYKPSFTHQKKISRHIRKQQKNLFGAFSLRRTHSYQCLSSIYKVNAKKFAIDVEFKSRRQSPQPDIQIPKPHRQIHADNISMHEDLLILLLICGKRKYCMSLPLNQEIFKTFSLVFHDLTNNKVVLVTRLVRQDW